MTVGWLALAALVGAVATAQALLTALIATCAMPLIRARIESAALEGKPRVLVALAAAPLATGLGLVTVCLAPSLATQIGLASDHCLLHIDHAIHLCFAHLPNAAPGQLIAATATVGAVVLGAAFWKAARLFRSGRREASSLAAIARGDGAVRWIESRLPLALTVGFVRPRVYVSRGFERGLDRAELDAAIAHELCHARKHDALVKLVTMALAIFHLPGVRREITELLELACERRADEYAADVVGDRIRVASALVRAHRIAGGESTAALAFARGSRNELKLRVSALLDARAATQRSWSPWLASATLAAAVVASHDVHHTIEHLLAFLG